MGFTCEWRFVLNERRGGDGELGYMASLYGSEHREVSLVALIFSMKWDKRCLLSIDGFNTGLEGLELSFKKKIIFHLASPLGIISLFSLPMSLLLFCK